MMNVIIRILVFNSFVYFLKADEEAKSEESKIALEDYSSIEVVAVAPKAGDTNEPKNLDRDAGIDNLDDILNNNEFNSMYNTENTVTRRFTAFLKEPYNDEVFKTAKISIEFKDSSSDKREKDDKKAQDEVENIKVADTRRNSNEKVINESEMKSTTKENEKIGTFREKNKISSVNKSLNHTTQNAVKKEQNTELTDEKSTKTVLEKPTSISSSTPEPKATIDDMDDLIFPYELNTFRENDDDEDYDRNLTFETRNSPHEDDTEFDDFRPNRRMLDSIPVLYYKAKTVDLEPSKQISTSRSPTGAVEELSINPSNILSPITLLNKKFEPVPQSQKNFQSPLYNYNEPNSKLFNNSHLENYLHNRIPTYANRINSNSQEILFNPIRFNNVEEILNGPNRFSNFRETHDGSSRFGNSKEIFLETNRFGNSKEVVNSPNRMGQEFPSKWNPGMINFPNRWVQPQGMLFPNIRGKQPMVLNSSYRWLQPGIFNIPNRFYPRMSEPRRNSLQSQGTHDSLVFETNAFSPSDFNQLDSYVYPYPFAHRDKMGKGEINPTFKKLAQASNRPRNLQLPIRYPNTYAPFDPRLYYAQRNLEMLQRPRRFSSSNIIKINRFCCY